MPFRKTQFAINEFYHIVQRGVEERNIFLDDEDHLRFINSLIVFNDTEPAPWGLRGFWDQRDPSSLRCKQYKRSRPLIEIHAFALMKNHFHLLIRQLTDKGISYFMRKVGGYSYYFNKKYKRIGPLFQGRFKAILIKTDNQLKSTFVYIHTNPVSIIEPGWKNWQVANSKRAAQFLQDYKWSSYRDYLETENIDGLVSKDFFLEIFGDKNSCQKEVESWIRYKHDLGKIGEIMLE